MTLQCRNMMLSNPDIMQKEITTAGPSGQNMVIPFHGRNSIGMAGHAPHELGTLNIPQIYSTIRVSDGQIIALGDP